MKAGLFITARMGSTRLKEKLIQKVKGKPILQYLIQRINMEFAPEIKSGNAEVIIVTGDKERNYPLEQTIKNCSIFYGDPDNIPKRHSQAAKGHRIDVIVSIDGDDILCSTKAMRAVYSKLISGKKYVKTEGLPLGLNAFGYSTSFLEEGLAKAKYDLLETGWGRIFDEKVLVSIKIPSKDEKFLRFTLDYNQDFEFFKAIITHPMFDIKKSSDTELIDLVLSEKIYEKNASIAEEYWKNFYKHRDEEEKKKTKSN